MKSRWTLSSGEWGGYSVAVILASALWTLNATLVVPPFTVPLWPGPLLIAGFVFSVIHRKRGETDLLSDAFFDADRIEESDEQALQPDALKVRSLGWGLARRLSARR